MIVATREKIYGLDVFTFKDSKGTPYQLTFDKGLNPLHVEVSLVNLFADDNSKFCANLRRIVSSIIYEYMIENKCTIYFDFKVDSRKGTLLFKKFVRWIKLETRVKPTVELTPYKDSNYVEFTININS